MRNRYRRRIGYNRNFKRCGAFRRVAFAYGVYYSVFPDYFRIKHHVVARKRFGNVFIGHRIVISNGDGRRRAVDFNDIIVQIDTAAKMRLGRNIRLEARIFQSRSRAFPARATHGKCADREKSDHRKNRN